MLTTVLKLNIRVTGIVEIRDYCQASRAMDDLNREKGKVGERDVTPHSKLVFYLYIKQGSPGHDGPLNNLDELVMCAEADL